MKLKTFLENFDFDVLHLSDAGLIIPVNMKHPTYDLTDATITGKVIVDTSSYTIHDAKVFRQYKIDVVADEYNKTHVIESKDHKYVYDKDHNIYVVIH